MQTQTFTALASAARTVTGTADLGAMPGGFIEMNVYIAVTATSGTPSMTVTYQASHDGVTFFDHTAGAALTAAANQLTRLSSNIGKFGRLSYAISGGTPSLTFSAVVETKRSD